jgi:hypothetical protein
MRIQLSGFIVRRNAAINCKSMSFYFFRNAIKQLTRCFACKKTAGVSDDFMLSGEPMPLLAHAVKKHMQISNIIFFI